MESSYGRLARIYDAEYRNHRQDIGLYLRLFDEERVAGPILDLGCGTGRITFPLAEAGHGVTGIDNSPAMLRRARRERRARPADVAARVRFSCQDLTSFALPSSFSAAVAAFSTFNMLTDEDARRACVRRVARHLAPSGLLLLDLIGPAAGRTVGEPGSVRVVQSRFRLPPSGHAVTKTVEQRPGRGHVEITYRYEVRRWGFGFGFGDDRLVDELAVHFQLAMPGRDEVEALLLGEGFNVERLIGDYQDNPLGRRSERMIVVARRL